MPGHNPSATKALEDAIVAKKPDKVRQAIEAGANVNAVIIHERIPYISLAIMKGDADIVHALLEAGADANRRGTVGTPLMYVASIKGPAVSAIIRDLADHGAELDQVSGHDGHELTALSLFLNSGDYMAATALLKCGANPDAPNANGSIPLMDAITADNIYAIKLLAKFKANLKNAILEAIKEHVVKSKFDPALYDTLLALGSDLYATHHDLNALHIACIAGLKPAVEYFCNHQMPLNSFEAIEKSYLYLALFMGKQDIYTFLVGRGADPDARDAKGYTLMHIAVPTAQIPNVQFLLDHGVRTDIADAAGNTPLHLLMRDINEIENAVADFTVSSKRFAQAPIHSMLRDLQPSDYPGTLRLILRAGALVNARNAEDLTPLDEGFRHLSSQVSAKNIEMLYLLARYGGLLSPGTTALFNHKRHEHPSELLALASILSYANAAHPYVLAARKADLTALESLPSELEVRNEALLNAIVMNHQTACEFLLNNGAEPLHRAADGNLPLHLASQAQHEHIALLLVQRGAYPINDSEDLNQYREEAFKWFNSSIRKRLAAAKKAYWAANPTTDPEPVIESRDVSPEVCTTPEPPLAHVQPISRQKQSYTLLLQGINQYLTDAEKSYRTGDSQDLADWLIFASQRLARAEKSEEADERELAPLSARISTYKAHLAAMAKPQSSKTAHHRPKAAKLPASTASKPRPPASSLLLAPALVRSSGTLSLQQWTDLKELYLRIDSLHKAYQSLSLKQQQMTEGIQLISAMHYNLIRVFELAKNAGNKHAGRVRAQLCHHYFAVYPNEIMALSLLCLAVDQNAVDLAALITKVRELKFYNSKVMPVARYEDDRPHAAVIDHFSTAIGLLTELYRSAQKFYESGGLPAAANAFEYTPHQADAARMHITVLGELLKTPHREALIDLLCAALGRVEANCLSKQLIELRNSGGHEVDTVMAEGFIREVISSASIADIVRTAQRVHEGLNAPTASSADAAGTDQIASLVSTNHRSDTAAAGAGGWSPSG